MRVTQGAFSFLPDLTDEQIEAQVVYALRNGWSVSLEHTDDPHPRNAYWTMWDAPMFDLDPRDVGTFMEQVRKCRAAVPGEYVKVIAYDARLGRQTTGLSFIVSRPHPEPPLRMSRTEGADRTQRYAFAVKGAGSNGSGP